MPDREAADRARLAGGHRSRGVYRPDVGRPMSPKSSYGSPTWDTAARSLPYGGTLGS
jgi:hypothetical protein